MAMHRSRKRQFDEIRSVNSSRSERSSIRFSESQRSNAEQACINCINKFMSTQRCLQRKSSARTQIEEEIQRLKQLNAQVDYNQLKRIQLRNDALNYNSQMMKRNKEAIVREKQIDASFMKQQIEKDKEALELLKKHREFDEQKLRSYNKEIYVQYLQTMKTKEENKKNRRKEVDNQVLPLTDRSRNEERINYNRDLLNQIKEKEQVQQVTKIKNEQEERRLLQQYHQEAQKYHADDYHLRDRRNPEIFKELKELEKKKKDSIIKQRKNNDVQRAQLLRKQNQEKAAQIQLKMKEMQQYVEGLKTQILAKGESERKLKKQEQQFVERIPKSTEEISKQYEIKKVCQSCHHNYPQQYIGKIPKLI